MMEKKKLSHLLKKFNSDKCDAQEIKALEDWYNSIENPVQSAQLDETADLEAEMLEDFHHRRLHQRMRSRADRQKKRVSIKFALLIALAFIGIAAIIFFMWGF